jgi:hypothetical protein
MINVLNHPSMLSVTEYRNFTEFYGHDTPAVTGNVLIASSTMKK